MRCGLSVRNTCCTNTQRKKQHVSCIRTFRWNPGGIPRPALITTRIDPSCWGFCFKILQRRNAFQVLTPQSIDTEINLMVTLLSTDWLTENLNNRSILTFWSCRSGNRRQDPSGANKLGSKLRQPLPPSPSRTKQGNILLPTPLDEIPDPPWSDQLQTVWNSLKIGSVCDCDYYLPQEPGWYRERAWYNRKQWIYISA